MLKKIYRPFIILSSSPSASIPQPISIHQCTPFTLVRAKHLSFFWQHSSLSFAYPLSLPAHNLNYFTAKLPLAFYLRRIPWMPVSAPIAMYVIPGVGWVVKLLEGWTNRLNEYDLIYSSLTDEHCFGYRLLGLVFWLMKRNL